MTVCHRTGWGRGEQRTEGWGEFVRLQPDREKVWLKDVSACCSLVDRITDWMFGAVSYRALKNVCSFNAGPDRWHNCSIHATWIILLFPKCLLWITHKFTSWGHTNLVYLHVLLVLTSHITLWVRKQKARKWIVYLLELAVQSYLWTWILLIYLDVRCCHAEKGKKWVALAL